MGLERQREPGDIYISQDHPRLNYNGGFNAHGRALGSGRSQPFHLFCEHPKGLIELRVFPDAFYLSGPCSPGRNTDTLFGGMGRKYIP
ncbi:MAG: hypothetical protein A4E63_02446 [Syntrophorhabdus sp. PtaU1.Bin050]|nr:MAG: hypothetical protein A4E63_02446 [Syntrophorhabdus sp. PtaU1.Bin050]